MKQKSSSTTLAHTAAASEILTTLSIPSRIMESKQRSQLVAGQELSPGESIVSPNGSRRLLLDQSDGNLTLRDRYDRVWWASEALMGEGGFKLVLYPDGNLAVRTKFNSMPWSSRTSGRGDSSSTLTVGDDGIVRLTSQGKVIWQPDARMVPAVVDRLQVGEVLRPDLQLGSLNGKHRLLYQRDGNLVLYTDNKAKWSSNYAARDGGQGPDFGLFVTEEDNLVIGKRYGRTPTKLDEYWWDAGVSRRLNGGTAVLILRDSGDAVLESEGVVTWSSNPELVEPWTEEPWYVEPDQLALERGQCITAEHPFYSPTRNYVATIQPYGGLVVKPVADNEIIWSSHDEESVVDAWMAVLSYHGELKLYNKNRKIIWSAMNQLKIFSEFMKLTDQGCLTCVLRSGGGTLFSSLTNRSVKQRGKTERLERNECIIRGQNLTSPNGKHLLTLNKYGNMVIESTDAPTPRRTTYFTNFKNITTAKYLDAAANTGLVIRDFNEEKIWKAKHDRTKTGWPWSRESPRMVLLDEGHAQLRIDNSEVWTNKELMCGPNDQVERLIAITGEKAGGSQSLKENASLSVHEALFDSTSNAYYLTFQSNGVFALYNRQGKQLWKKDVVINNEPKSSSDSDSNSTLNTSKITGKITLEKGGILTYHDSATNQRTELVKPAESIGSSSEPCKLVLQDDGDVVIKCGLKVIWATGTGGGKSGL